jgi:predicted nucleotidyltransferase
MNIKITKEEFDFIKNNTDIVSQSVVGSRLYGTAKEDSDTDILIVYKELFESDLYYPNYHQLQYDDIDNNIQYLLCSERQFYKNLFSGDATINADVILYGTEETDEEKLNMLRTFNIIKAFIGFAKRDLKQIDKGKNKLFHIERGLYCAKMLLDNKLPNIEVIKTMGTCAAIAILKDLEEMLRKQCNDMFDKGELTMFPKKPVIGPINSLEAKIIEANNIKEFKY